MTESLSFAERKVCKRFRMPPRSFRKRFRRTPSVKKVFKAAAFLRQFGWYHGVVFVPASFLWQGWRLFLFFASPERGGVSAADGRVLKKSSLYL